MEIGKSSPQQWGLAVDKTNVLKALDGLLDTGMAVLGRGVELFPHLVPAIGRNLRVWRQ
jgi:hypothetical protein